VLDGETLMAQYAACVCLVCLVVLTSCSGRGGLRLGAAAAARPAATITGDRTDTTVAYAAEELRAFLDGTIDFGAARGSSAAASMKWTFDLQVDTAMEAGTFSVSCNKESDGRLGVKLRGADPACVLHATYTMLERTGICFDVLGPVRPKRLDLDGLVGWEVTVRPAVRKRGIRQHINFPMDISSYPLPEAREYIRNLARLRFNHVTFHSYDGQWVPYKRPDGEDALAGSFFYGQRHDLPARPHACDVIRNSKTYCIPDIEPYYDLPNERSPHLSRCRAGTRRDVPAQC